MQKRNRTYVWTRGFRRFGRLAVAVLLVTTVLQAPGTARDVDGFPPESIAQFGVTADRMLLLPKHIYVSSGWITVQPDVARLGWGSLFAPPFFACPARVTWTLNGKPVEVADYTWYPSEMVLHGKPAAGLNVRGRVMPLAGMRAVICELSLRNPSARTISSEIALGAECAVGYSSIWPYPPPEASRKNTQRMVQPNRLSLRCRDGRAELALALAGEETSSSDERLSLTVALRPGQQRTLRAVVVLDTPKEAPAVLARILRAPERFITGARRNWQRRIEQLRAAAPALKTPHRELEAFYDRALFTFLSCRWDSDAMVFRPWYATSGMDGGAVCSYLWDLSYTSKMAVLCDAAAVRKYLLAFARADLTNGYALNPLDGRPLGLMYSYNYYNLTRLAHDYVTLTGDLGVLSEKIGDETFLDYLYRYALRPDDLGRPPTLVDYGTNKNLLELNRTNDYEHYTPSPNGERMLIYRQLDDLFSWAGRKPPDDLVKRAEAFRKHFVERLWDPEHRWFHSLDTNQQPRIAYSIQIFDLLRTGMLSREQQEAVLSHLNESEFLSPYGVHSLSKQDEGYDPNDADWGGPGAYAGDVPELVVDLIQSGHEKQGVDVLKRILWWGRFPYIPQAVLAASRDYRHNGRANVISGLSGGQAILNGLLGIRVDDRRVYFRPVNDPIVAGLKLSNLRIRGQRFGLEVDDRAENYSVRTGGRIVRCPVGLPLQFPLPRTTFSRIHE